MKKYIASFILLSFLSLLLYAAVDRIIYTKRLIVNEASPGTDKITIDPPALTSDITLTWPSSTSNIVGDSASQALTNKTINADSNTITNIEDADIKALAAIDAAKIHDGSISNTEFGYLNNASSELQSQINGKASTTLNNIGSSAINVDIIPDSNNDTDLGSAALGWAEAYINKIFFDSNSQTTTIAGSPSASSSEDYILPATDGIANDVLSTNGSGVLSWVAGLSDALSENKIFVGNSSNTVEQRYVGNVLDTKHLLTSADFPDTTDLYGWHINGTGSFDGSAWFATSAQTLTDSGTGLTQTSSPYFLGTQTYSNFNGSTDYLEATGSNFDALNESFTIWAWLKNESATGNHAIMSKGNADANERSFLLYIASNSLYLDVNYTNGGSGNIVGITGDITGHVNDNYHFVAAVYDTSNGSLKLFYDGKDIGYSINSDLIGNRYNSSATELRIGNRDRTTDDMYFIGDILEVGYKKDVLDSNELRKIYAAACRKFVNVDGDGKVAILDGRKNNGSFELIPANVTDIANYSVMGDVTGFNLYVPENGMYKIRCQSSVRIDDENDNMSTTNMGIQWELYNSTSATRLMTGLMFVGQGYNGAATRGAYSYSLYFESKPIYLAKDTLVKLRDLLADNTTGPTDDSNYSNNYFSWEKLD